MNEQLQAAVDVLLGQLEEEMAAVSTTKKTINTLSKKMGKPEPFPDVETDDAGGRANVRIRPDLYYGKKLATAVGDYLKLRHQACRVEDVLAGLKEGGFDFAGAGWTDERGYLRSLAMVLAKNTKTFHRLPNGTFGLSAWYPEVVQRAARRADGEVREVGVDDAEGETA